MAKNMYQKRIDRKNKKEAEINNVEQNPTNTNINWYPGHMVKAQNEIKESLKLIDIVVEVLDARIPNASQNPLVPKLTNDKAKIVVLNKSDLADSESLKRWNEYFKSNNIEYINTNANLSENIKMLINTIKKVGSKIYEEKNKNKTIDITPIYRVLIIGIPNVGKSTIINKIANKQVANVGNKPGVTQKKQWIRVAGNIDLLDTPGLLWPNLGDKSAGIKLALTGNIKQEVIDIEELAVDGIGILIKTEKYKKMIKEKYSLNDDVFNLDYYDILEAIGRKRGCIVSGGNVDMTKAANAFVEDLKSGKLGKISLE